MPFKKTIKRLIKRLRGIYFKVTNSDKEKFLCPLCRYSGPFMDSHDVTGLRKHAECPNCSAMERHRIMWLTIETHPDYQRFSELSVIHFAPEPELEKLFRKTFGSYTSADLCAPGVDFHVDLTNLPFDDHSYDVVIAAHVLEHIKEDSEALKHIQRILKPGGFAILQVPIVGKTTVEYPEANHKEWGHVRAPGEDYFDRFDGIFSRIDRHRSSSFDPKFQTYIYEDRSSWPADFPLRQTSSGSKHEDIVPVCFA